MIYLDNAATTIADPEVIEMMSTVMSHFYGNPSSSHDLGKEAKQIIEESRNSIACIIGCEPEEIIFTSGGTESVNIVFHNLALNPNVKHIITSPLEHPAVLHSINHFGLSEKTEFVNICQDATPDLNHLKILLEKFPNSAVVLMHVHNECGAILDVQSVGELCQQFNALFFTDTVQSIGKSELHFGTTHIDFAACSAHKFHGPRGIGFLYKKKTHQFQAHTAGGGQENAIRPGTENTAAIAGMCRALEIAAEHMGETRQKHLNFKSYIQHEISNHFPEICFVGKIETTVPNILNIALPLNAKNLLIAEKLNEIGFAVSSGSACHASTGKSNLYSVIGLEEFIPLRISFGRFSSLKEVELFSEGFIHLYQP